MTQRDDICIYWRGIALATCCRSHPLLNVNIEINLRSPSDVIDDVIIMKNTFFAWPRTTFHIWGKNEAVFNISKFSKWPPFWARDKLFFTGSDTGSWTYQKDSQKLVFPMFWTFDWGSSSNIDRDISISKFDLLCDLVTSWLRIYINVVIISWYPRTGSLMMISLLVFQLSWKMLLFHL